MEADQESGINNKVQKWAGGGGGRKREKKEKKKKNTQNRENPGFPSKGTQHSNKKTHTPTLKGGDRRKGERETKKIIRGWENKGRR